MSKRKAKVATMEIVTMTTSRMLDTLGNPLARGVTVHAAPEDARQLYADGKARKASSREAARVQSRIVALN